jgi:hypothetical protein
MRLERMDDESHLEVEELNFFEDPGSTSTAGQRWMDLPIQVRRGLC